MSRKNKIPDNPSEICSFCGKKCKNWKGRQTHEGQYCKKNPASKVYESQDAPTPEPEVASPLAPEVTPDEVIEAEKIIEAQYVEPPPPVQTPAPEPKPETPPPQAQPEPEPEPEPKGKETDWTKIGAMVLVIVAIIFIIVGIYLLWSGKKAKTQKENELKSQRQAQAPQTPNNAPPGYGPGEYPDV